MMPENKVLQSKSDISMKDLVWKEGVKSDFKKTF